MEALVGPADTVAPLDILPDSGVPAALLQRRPDIAAALARLRAADADVAAAAARRFPQLTLTGTLGFLATSAGQLFTGDALFGSVGTTLAGPLLDFGRVRALVAEQTGRRAEALANYRGTVLQAMAEVETELARARAQRERSARLAEQIRADTDTTDLGRVLYRRGLNDFLAVLDAQRSLSASRDARLVADGEALDAGFRLWRAVGGDFVPSSNGVPR